MSYRPPLPGRLLSFLLRGLDADILRGDIEESFQRRMENSHPPTRARAQLAYLIDVLRSIFAWWSPDAVQRRFRAHGSGQPQDHREKIMGIGGSLSDVMYACRSLVRRPGFTAVAVLTLGLGIGSAVTIFSVVDAVMIRSLPYRNAASLVRVGITFPGQEWDDRNGDLQHLASVSASNFEDWQARAGAFERLGAVEQAAVLLPDTGQGAELVTMARVTGSFLDLLSVVPVVGRSFLPEDLGPGTAPVVILSHATWLKRYGGDPSIVGKAMPTAGFSYSVIGVLPADFRPPEALMDAGTEFWMPLDLGHARYAGRGTRRLNILGRLRSGVGVDAARDEIDAIQESLAGEFPNGNVYPDGRRFGAGVNTLHAETVGTSRRAVLIFLGASGLLLLIAGLNAANLLLVRGMDREGELGVRRALGAGRGRLVRGLLAESVLLAAGGGALGILFSYVGIGAFLRFSPSSLPRLGEVAVNSRILAISAIASLAIGVVVGIIPAFRLTRGNLATRIRGNAGTTLAPTGARLRTVLVAAQLALALVLGVGASLLVNSFLRVRAVDPGFRSDQLTVFSMPMKRPGAGDLPMWQDWDELLTEIRSVPGIEAVDASSNLPFQQPNWGPRVLLPEDPPEFDRSGIAGYVVTLNFFETMGIPLVRGRSFGPRDGPDGARTVIANEEFVRMHLDGRAALGSSIRFGDEAETNLEIVGVVGNVIQTRAEEGSRPAVYVPYTQMEWPVAHVAVRSDRDTGSLAGDLRRAAARFSQFVPVQDLGPIRSRIGSVRTEPRFNALLLGSFAGVALLLAGVGLYGTMAHSVGRRTRELGIRQALGADRTDIFRMVLREGLIVSGAGLLTGFAGALILTRFLERFLFEVGTMDMPTFLAAAAVLSIVILLAMIRPAHRATRVDLLGSLRAD